LELGSGRESDLRAGLAAALMTPLSFLGDRPLREVHTSDRLNELSFEMALAGGDEPTGTVSTADIADVLAKYLPATGPLVGYPERLTDPVLSGAVRGYLTGSMDLVFRTTTSDGQRWYIADYKSNRLGAPDRKLTTWDYHPAALDAEMQRHHYPLQGLLYLVALHRYLAWRLVGYQPEQHLGGMLYLFLRGMVGPDTPKVGGQTCGVFSWRPPAELVIELSALLGTGAGQ
jgi:exodeoxyribonuclease V beta subunit